PAGTSGAQQANANINVFNAATSSYPNADSQRYVCTSGGATFSGAIGLGESLEVELAPGDLVIDVYDGEGVESCAGAPDRRSRATQRSMSDTPSDATDIDAIGSFFTCAAREVWSRKRSAAPSSAS
ncbi:MAG: hypothetical protein ACK5PP_19325, partial [Acidimicrobiales bacterium]